MKEEKPIIPKFEIYTDGSSKSIGKTRFGGWAFIVLYGGCEIARMAGSENNSTNQRMELMAILEALKYVKTIRHPKEQVIIYSDSAYAINCYKQQWYINWQSNGWLNSKKEEVANKELWYEIMGW